MRQLRWGLKAEFPYTKVFFLGILLTLLGSACVVVSVIGIIKLAWGHYVSTGMWGGVAITASGLVAMYSARRQSSTSARLYFMLSVAACVITFAMLVLSAGGLTYKSDFYHPVRFDSDLHKVTLFFHGSVLSISVLSLACNLLSVIVCCRFMTREKERPESLKLRRLRRRRSDSNSSRRNGSLRAASSAPGSSINSRTPLFGSDRARKHSRQRNSSEVSTNLKIPTERISHRRDSEQSKGSSRSRHSHNRQSSSVSQQSQQAGDSSEVATAILRDSGHLISLSGQQDGMSSRATRDNVRDSFADTITDSVSEHLVFDPDEEPPPPYEERRPTGDSINSTGDETDTETVVGSSSVVVPSYLPLNIPVTRIGGQLQMESFQRQPPPSGSRSASQQGRDSTAISSPNLSSELLDNCVSLMRMALTDDREDEESHPHSEERSHSPEICALTGARLTPVAAIQPDTVGSNTSASVSCIQPSPGSSNASIPIEVGQLLAGQVPVSSRSQSMPVQTLSSSSPSAFASGIRSPNSAFRPVGKGMMPSSSVPLHNFFSPISAPGSPHHTVYSPVACATSNPRLASNPPASPRHSSTLIASTDSLRGGNTQSSLWKKIPLPTSHNHSNKTSAAPAKEVTSKNIPGPAQPVSSRDSDASNDLPTHALPRQSSREATDSQSLEIRARTQFASLPARNTSPKRSAGFQFATIPSRNVKEAAPAVTSIDRQHVSRRREESRRRSGAAGNHTATVGEGFTALAKQSGAACNIDLRCQQGPADPVCRSAGIQATDDGGISSSMDRTHRWVLGTLPTGTQYQGVTRSMAHVHLTSSQGSRAVNLGAVSKHGARVHSGWNMPGPQVETSRSHASHPSRHESIDRSNKAIEPQRDSSFSSPKKSSGPVAPKPIRPNIAESAGNGSSAFSSHSKSHPVAPKAVRPLPVEGSSFGASQFSAPPKPQPVAPKPIKPPTVNDNNGAFSTPQTQGLMPAKLDSVKGEGAFAVPVKSHPLVQSVDVGDRENKGFGAFAKPLQSEPAHFNLPASFGNGTGAFSSLAKSQPLVPKPLRPGECVGNGKGGVSSPAKPEPLVPNYVWPGNGIGNGNGAFTSLANSRLRENEDSKTGHFLPPAKPQLVAPRPVHPTESNVGSEDNGSLLTPTLSHPLAETVGNGSGAFSISAESAQPVSCKLQSAMGNGASGAFSSYSSLTSNTFTQPAKPAKPIPAERTSKVCLAAAPSSSDSAGSSAPSAGVKLSLTIDPSAGSKSCALSPNSRLPRYQPVRQNMGEDLGAAAAASPRSKDLQTPQLQDQQQSWQQQPQQPQPQRVPAVPPRAPPQPQPMQRQRQPQPLPQRLMPGQGQNQNQPPEKPLFSVLL